MCDKTSPENADYEMRMTTQEELIKLGKQLAQNDKKPIQQEQQDTTAVDYITFLSEWDDLTGVERKLKMLDIIQKNASLTKHTQQNETLINELKSEIEELQTDIEYHQEEEHKYLKLVDELEAKQKHEVRLLEQLKNTNMERENYWTKRVVNLRDKCVSKNFKINVLCMALFFTNLINYVMF